MTEMMKMKNSGKIPGINIHSRIIPGTSFIVTIKNRFYSKVLIPNKNGCMEYIGSKKNRMKYGCFRVNGVTVVAHKFSYLLHKGNIPENLLVLHECDNGSCVAPDHLKLGTYKDNSLDAMKRNRLIRKKGCNSPFAKLSQSNINEIKKLLADNIKQIDIAKKFNVHQGTISRIKIGKRKI